MFFLLQAKRFVASMGPADEEAKVLKKIAELNLGQSTSAFSKFGCKNAGFVEAMVLRGTSLHRGGFELTEVGGAGGREWSGRGETKEIQPKRAVDAGSLFRWRVG